VRGSVEREIQPSGVYPGKWNLAYAVADVIVFQGRCASSIWTFQIVGKPVIFNPSQLAEDHQDQKCNDLNVNHQGSLVAERNADAVGPIEI